MLFFISRLLSLHRVTTHKKNSRVHVLEYMYFPISSQFPSLSRMLSLFFLSYISSLQDVRYGASSQMCTILSLYTTLCYSALPSSFLSSSPTLKFQNQVLTHAIPFPHSIFREIRDLTINMYFCQVLIERMYSTIYEK